MCWKRPNFLKNTRCVHEVCSGAGSILHYRTKSPVCWTELGHQRSKQPTFNHRPLTETLRGCVCVCPEKPQSFISAIWTSVQVSERNADWITLKTPLTLYHKSNKNKSLSHFLSLPRLLDVLQVQHRTLCPRKAHPEWGEMLSAPASSSWFFASCKEQRTHCYRETQATLNALCMSLWLTLHKWLHYRVQAPTHQG